MQKTLLHLKTTNVPFKFWGQAYKIIDKIGGLNCILEEPIAEAFTYAKMSWEEVLVKEETWKCKSLAKTILVGVRDHTLQYKHGNREMKIEYRNY